MSLSLYEINAEYQAMLEQVNFEAADNDGLVADELWDALNDLEMSRETKICNTARYIKNLRAEAAAIEAEEKALYERRKAALRTAERLETTLSNILAGEKFSDATVAVSWRKSEAVVCTRQAEAMDDYVRIKTTIDWDKAAIKEALKAGKEIDFAKIETRNNISIK
jgi:ferredoxin-NADP reductase